MTFAHRKKACKSMGKDTQGKSMGKDTQGKSMGEDTRGKSKGKDTQGKSMGKDTHKCVEWVLVVQNIKKLYKILKL